jgi:hypothetical protein
MTARWTAAQLAGKISEHELQVNCVRWFRHHYRRYAHLLFSIPNGARLYGTAKQRGMQWKKLEAEGAQPGVADLFLAVPSGDLCGLWIEMKTIKGRQSDTQRRFEMAVVAMNYGYAMPRTYEEFQTVVGQYLANGAY